MHRVRVPKLLWRRLLVMGMADFSPGFSQTSRVFGQVRPFRRNPGFLGYNPLTVQELASGSRDFPDEEGTERAASGEGRVPHPAVPETSPMKRGLKGRMICRTHGDLFVPETSP